MRIIFLILIILYIKNADAQSDTLFVFNNAKPIKYKYGQIVKKSDICATDTLKTNIKGLKILSYSCTTICAIDFQINEKSNVISKELKTLLCGCLRFKNQKIYFEDIVLCDDNGKEYFINIKQAIIKIK